jgi:integrase
MAGDESLAKRDEGQAALVRALALWAEATTDASSARRADLLRDKQKAVAECFARIGRGPAEVTPLDVEAWRRELEGRRPRLSPATVYYRLARLASFYSWAMRHTALGQVLSANPVHLARPKAPKKYQTEAAKAWTDEQVIALLDLLRRRANSERLDLAAKRDYALLLLYLLTGMRRAEVIGLRGRDVELRDEALVIKERVKGGDYLEREVSDPAAREALIDYLRAGGRVKAVGSPAPLWVRHDRAEEVPQPLTSHGFVKNLKRYAREAGLGEVHLHQTRHTYARLVAEHAGSLLEVQEALGHRDLATTRVYVRRVVIKRDRHSRQIARRLKLHPTES